MQRILWLARELKIRDNWNKIAPVFESVYQKLNSAGIITDINAIKSAFAGLVGTFLNSGISSAFEIIGDSVNFLLDKFINVWTYVRDNWSKISSILTPIAVTIGAVTAAIGIYNLAMFAASTATTIATIAQNIFNTALWACPLTWIVVGIIAVIGIIYLAIAAFNKLSGSSVSATGIISGSVATIGAFIFNMFLAVQDIVKGVLEFLYNGWVAFGNFFSNVFKDPIGSVIRLFGDFGDGVLGIVEKIARGVCKYLGISYKEENEVWVDRVNRIYKYGKVQKTMEVLNADGKNYVSVRELAELIGKNVSYDNNTKITEIK